MASPERLAVEVTTASGAVFRWGGDEPDPINVPRSVQFGTTVPGGFKDCSITLTRRIDLEWSDLNLLDAVRIYGAGNETVWEGRVSELPRSQSDDFSITVQCVGWNAHLKDDTSFREIYVDRDLTRWGAPSITRKQAYITAGYTEAGTGATADPTNGYSAVTQSLTGPWAASAWPAALALYDANNISIGSVYYSYSKGSNTGTGGSWYAGIHLGTDDTFASLDDTTTLLFTGAGTGTLSATTRGRKYAEAIFQYGADNGTSAEYTFLWYVLAVYGLHGLTKQGTAGTHDAQGFYASDIVADVVGRAAPLLNFTTGAGGSIEPTGFVIPQATFPDPTTADDVVGKVNAYHLYEWGVYDDREFFFRAPDPDRCTWRARSDLGLTWDLAGDQADDLYNGVIVQYTDALGQTKTAGPPGSGCDDESALLQDTSTDNPVNAHGIPKKWGVLQMSVQTTGGATGGAVQVGYVWLAEHSLPQRRGSMTLRPASLGAEPMLQHPTKGSLPISRVRAGDYITVSDALSDTPRRIIETRYDHDGRTQTLSLDNSVFKLDAIMERLAVQLVGVV